LDEIYIHRFEIHQLRGHLGDCQRWVMESRTHPEIREVLLTDERSNYDTERLFKEKPLEQMRL
jgi:hypothetical protein